MAYTKADYEAPDTGASAKLAYGKINHAEIDIPMMYCRLDLHWFAKEEMVKQNRPLEVKSFVLSHEEMNAFLREDTKESMLGTVYKLLRLKDPEYFKDVEDHFNPKVDEEVKYGEVSQEA